MHLLPRMNGMLAFTFMGSVDLPGVCHKRLNKKWTIRAHSGTRTHKLDISSLLPYQLNYQGFDESCTIEVTFVHTCTFDTNVYIGIGISSWLIN